MADDIQQKVIAIIEETLAGRTQSEAFSIGPDDSMETIEIWDSMSFMSIFLAINEAFGVDPDFDDAIHYTSVRALHEFLEGRVG